jgi:hypothetical protein
VMEMERRRVSRVKIKAIPLSRPAPDELPEVVPATAQSTAEPVHEKHEKLVPAGPTKRSRRK